MKLNKVIINNFRNIQHVEYDLDQRNIFCGPNKQGKTNTISAIYWALTGYQIDGTSDSAKNKPFTDTSLEVSVELQFDTFKMKRTFQEDWVKTRGSNEVTLKGHKQNIYINDVKFTIKAGEDKIKALLGLNINLSTSKFDLLRCVIDPYYIVNMSSQNNWKVLREFIIELVGDVTPQDVFAALPDMGLESKSFIAAKDYDTATCSQFLKTQIKHLNEDIKSYESKIEGFKEAYVQPPLNDCLEARKQITILQGKIEKIKDAQRSYVNPKVAKLQESLEYARMELLKSQTNDAMNIQNYNGSLDTQIAHIQEELDHILPTFNQHRNIKNNLDNRMLEKQMELRKMKLERETFENQRKQKLNEYHQANAMEFVYNVQPQSAIVCPECGCVLNQDVMANENKMREDALRNFEMEKQFTIEGILKLGKELRNKVDNLTFGIEDLEKEVYQMQDELVEATQGYEDADKQVKEFENQIASLRSQRKVSVIQDSAETKRIKDNIVRLQNELEEAKRTNTSNFDYDVQINELNVQIAEHNRVLDQERDYERGQQLIKQYEFDLQNKIDKKVEYEVLLINVEQYIKTKLELMDSNVKKVFGERLTFKLVESNIKEGSFDEVCKPTVLDKQTLLIDGSGAEKIQSGIYIIESIKEKLAIYDTPIIFDEADKLDSVSLTKLYTNSQIISTKVDDVNFDKVTLVTSK